MTSRPPGLTPSPRAQTWNPVQVRSRPQNARGMRIAACPFSHPTVGATLSCGGMRTQRCPCSGLACPSTTAPPCCWHSARTIRPLRRRSGPYRTRGLYLGTTTMGDVPDHRTGDGLGHARLGASWQGHGVVRCQEVRYAMLRHDGTAEPVRVSPPEAVAYPI